MTRPDPEQLARWIAEGLGDNWDRMYANSLDGRRDQWRRAQFNVNALTQAEFFEAARIVLERWPT